MVILGIDPGLAIVGYGVLEYEKSRFRVLDFGAIRTPAGMRTEDRLCKSHRGMNELIDRYRPSEMAVEELFFVKNITTGISVAEARGVILLACTNYGVEIHEYTPLQVKQAVAGYGRAEKRQVMDMTKRLLHLEKIPRPDDAADGLALALCHARSSTSLLSALQRKP